MVDDNIPSDLKSNQIREKIKRSIQMLYDLKFMLDTKRATFVRRRKVRRRKALEATRQRARDLRDADKDRAEIGNPVQTGVEGVTA